MCVEIHLYTNYTNMYINSFGCFLKEIWVKGKKKAKDKFHFKRHAMTIIKLWNFLSRACHQLSIQITKNIKIQSI